MTFLSLVQQVPSDSVAVAIGTTVGAVVSAKLIGLFGLISKLTTDAANKVLSKLGSATGKLPAAVQAIIAFAIAQGVVFVNSKFLGLGGPLATDLSNLGTVSFGAVVWGVAMGADAFVKKVLKINLQ